MAKMRTQSALFTLFLGALAALPPISTDMALPALTQIGQALHTTPKLAGQTLSLFMFGFALSPIVYGPLSDRWGRRPCLMLGLLLFVAGACATSLTSSIGGLLLARFIQGAGAGAGMTMAFAIVRDAFAGRAAQSRLAMITVVANIAPIVSPALGALLVGHIGWRGIYAVTFVCGMALLLLAWAGFTETHTETGRRNTTAHTAAEEQAAERMPQVSAVQRTSVASTYWQLLSHRTVRTHILVNGLGFAWMFSYVCGSPLILLDLLHVSTLTYSLMFACTGFGIVLGATLNARLTARGVRTERLLMTAIVLACIASALLLCLAFLPALHLSEVMPLLVLATFSFGLAAPGATHGALMPLPALAGAAGGLLTSVQMMLGALGSALVAVLIPAWGLAGLALTMLVAALLAAGLYYRLYRALQHAHQLSAGKAV